MTFPLRRATSGRTCHRSRLARPDPKCSFSTVWGVIRTTDNLRVSIRFHRRNFFVLVFLIRALNRPYKNCWSWKCGPWYKCALIFTSSKLTLCVVMLFIKVWLRKCALKCLMNSVSRRINVDIANHRCFPWQHLSPFQVLLTQVNKIRIFVSKWWRNSINII